MWGPTARQPNRPQSSSTAQRTHEEPGKEFRGPRAPQDPRFETSISPKSTVDAGEPDEAPVRPRTDHLRWSWKLAAGPSIALVNTRRNQFFSPSRNGAGGREPEGAGRPTGGLRRARVPPEPAPTKGRGTGAGPCLSNCKPVPHHTRTRQRNQQTRAPTCTSSTMPRHFRHIAAPFYQD